MSLPEEENVLVEGDHPLVGHDKPLTVDKGGAPTVRVPPLVDGEGVVVNSRLGSIWPGCSLRTLASGAVTNLQLTNVKIWFAKLLEKPASCKGTLD